MIIAPLPDPNRVTDPLWQTLFHTYHRLIAPLRYSGFTTDIEMGGGENHIRAVLGDGTELIIASEHALPIDPAEVTGWTVVRRTTADPSQHTVLYDSTPGSPQSHHTTDLIPMFSRIDALDAAPRVPRLVVSATYVSRYGVPHPQAAGTEGPAVAIARYFHWSSRLINQDGFRRVWERPEQDDYPLSLFEKTGQIVTVRVTPMPSDD